MKRAICFVLLLPVAALARASPVSAVLAQGASDGNVPAWSIVVDSPAGWTRDCCTYAKAIGVDAVLYRGAWTGKPQQVMVLNVWPRKLPDLAAEVQADRRNYLQADPAAKTTSFAVRHAGMPCEAIVYEGGDHVDDVVAFCDPGRASGIRLSWSISFDDNDPARRALLDAFMDVVVGSRYERHAPPVAHAG